MMNNANLGVFHAVVSATNLQGRLPCCSLCLATVACYLEGMSLWTEFYTTNPRYRALRRLLCLHVELLLFFERVA